MECIAAAHKACSSTPYHLMGHSWGCLVALEMARQLEEAGRWVPGVILLDPSPDMFDEPNGTGTGHDASHASSLVETLQLALRCGVGGLSSELCSAVRDSDVERASAAARAAFGKDTFAQIQAVASARDHNLRLRPQALQAFPRRLKAPVQLVLAHHQSTNEWDRIDKRGKLAGSLGRIAEDICTMWTEGDHYSMIQPPHSEALARALSKTFEVSNQALGENAAENTDWLNCIRRDKKRRC